jgi:hypothetical protein
MLQMFEEDPELVILTSDEAHFHLNGNVDKQNLQHSLGESYSPAKIFVAEAVVRKLCTQRSVVSRDGILP